MSLIPRYTYKYTGLTENTGPRNTKLQNSQQSKMDDPLPEVGYPADKVHGAVSDGDQGVLGEEDGLRPHGRLGELSEHNPGHAGLE